MDGKTHIMVVEDHTVNLKLVRDLLEMDGFEVVSCIDAESALECLQTIRPDMILMDIGLPGMSGLELTRILKAEAQTKDIKIIAVTAFAMKTDKDKVMEAGCDGYITKPINTRTFTGQILDMLK